MRQIGNGEGGREGGEELDYKILRDRALNRDTEINSIDVTDHADTG